MTRWEKFKETAHDIGELIGFLIFVAIIVVGCAGMEMGNDRRTYAPQEECAR